MAFILDLRFSPQEGMSRRVLLRLFTVIVALVGCLLVLQSPFRYLFVQMHDTGVKILKFGMVVDEALVLPGVLEYFLKKRDLVVVKDLALFHRFFIFVEP